MNSSATLTLILTAISLAGCASLKNTPQQDYVWDRLKSCDRFTTIYIDRVESDGRYWVRYVGGTSELGPFQDCMRKAIADRPFVDWLKARR